METSKSVYETSGRVSGSVGQSDILNEVMASFGEEEQEFRSSEGEFDAAVQQQLSNLTQGITYRPDEY